MTAPGPESDGREGVGASKALPGSTRSGVHRLQRISAETHSLRPRQGQTALQADATYTFAAFSTVTGIFFGCTAGTLGKTMVSTPADRWAWTASKSAPSGRVKARVKRP